MGKRSIAKFLAAVPLTASIAVNTSVPQNKNDIQFDSDNRNNKNQSFQIDKKDQPNLLNDWAIDIVKRDDSKNTKIVFAAAESGKLDQVKVEDTSNKVSKKDSELADEQLAKMEKMVAGYPIEKMLPFIAKRRPETAAFLVAIAKKESNWGKVSPKSKSGDCFNYWGFKDHRFPFAAGHSCFPSREVAIETVGNRIDKLVSNGRNTPAKISIWKCGSACAKDGNVGKWISDVGAYFNPIMKAL
jgi:hypothetical protein